VDSAFAQVQAAAMTESPYTMPLEEFERLVRVPMADTAEVQPVPGGTTDLDWGDGHLPMGDGGADGDCD
jgi:hypothetical protein